MFPLNSSKFRVPTGRECSVPVLNVGRIAGDSCCQQQAGSPIGCRLAVESQSELLDQPTEGSPVLRATETRSGPIRWAYIEPMAKSLLNNLVEVKSSD